MVLVMLMKKDLSTMNGKDLSIMNDVRCDRLSHFD